MPTRSSINDMPTRVVMPDDCFQFLSLSGSKEWEIFSQSIGRVVGGKFELQVSLIFHFLGMYQVSDLLRVIMPELIHLDLGEYIRSKVPSLSFFLHRLPEMNALNHAGIPVLSALSSAMQTLQRWVSPGKDQKKSPPLSIHSQW